MMFLSGSDFCRVLSGPLCIGRQETKSRTGERKGLVGPCGEGGLASPLAESALAESARDADSARGDLLARSTRKHFASATKNNLRIRQL